MITFLHPNQVQAALVDAMVAYDDWLRLHFPNPSIEIHSDWNPPGTGGHVNESQHYLGLACDFHVNNVPLVDAWMGLERFPQFGGIGIYPWWNTAGLHADVRVVPVRARWYRDKNGTYGNVDSSLVKILK